MSDPVKKPYRKFRKKRNFNYQKGRRFEYRCRNWLKKYGYYVLRAYASKGAFDLIAVPPKRDRPDYAEFIADTKFPHTPLLIQCKAIKNGYVSPAEEKDLQECARAYDGQVLVIYPVARHLEWRLY